MQHFSITPLRIGDWRVDPISSEISRSEQTVRLELRAMRLLLCLAEHAGGVVAIDTLLDQVWSGVTVSPDSVYQAVTSLRRVLGDDARRPAYIETVPRFGYRLVATVSPWDNPPVAPSTHPSTTQIRNGYLLIACAAFLLALGIGAWLFVSHANPTPARHTESARPVPPSQRSVAVLPFVDLTEGMKQGEFTDGMTEELIDKLSKVPGLRVPSPTSIFYFKDKNLPLSYVANQLGVAYVLDGSVRKSGTRLRVAARLVRADTGFVVWSESYDRPWHYTLMLQDDIAGELAAAVETSLD
jgi:transcriptional activator of cad operon